MYIGAIYGGVNPVSAWDYHKELKATPGGGAASAGDAPSPEVAIGQVVAVASQGGSAACTAGDRAGRVDSQSHPTLAFQAFSPWSEGPMIVIGEAVPETPNASINTLIAKTASTG